MSVGGGECGMWVGVWMGGCLCRCLYMKSNNNNNNCLKSNIQCIEIRVQWTVHIGADSSD